VGNAMNPHLRRVFPPTCVYLMLAVVFIYMLVAKIVDANKKNWWFKFYGVSFFVLSIRQDTVLVKSCSDEGFQEPFNIHEFPKSAVKFIEAKPFP